MKLLFNSEEEKQDFIFGVSLSPGCPSQFDIKQPLLCEETNCFDCWSKALEPYISIEPESKWIPVSERLPEDGVKVLLSVKLGCGYVHELGEYMENAREWCPYDEFYSYTWDDWSVIAWQPLPQPYKEDHQ